MHWHNEPQQYAGRVVVLSFGSRQVALIPQIMRDLKSRVKLVACEGVMKNALAPGKACVGTLSQRKGKRAKGEEETTAPAVAVVVRSIAKLAHKHARRTNMFALGSR